MPCLSTVGARDVTQFGRFTPNASDAATRATNTATLNKAIDQVGLQSGGGAVCLPAGSYFLTNRQGDSTAVYIARSNVTLWGAGMVGSAGGTRLVTRSDWNLDGGSVFRGFGIYLEGTPNATAPLNNITLRDFELDGGAGYTGNFGWPANTSTGDGWDISHKGIVLALNSCVNNVRLERVWTHAYRGEIIYAGGQCLQTVTVEGIRSEDTNGSTFNITGNFTVNNSSFGKSYIWMEVGAGGPYNSSTWTNNTFSDAATLGINIAQGDLRAGTPHVFENNRFQRCGKSAFFLGGGAGGPITIRNNSFESCSGVTTGQVPNPAPWARYENQLLTFEGNTLTDSDAMFFMGGILNNSAFRNNRMVNRNGYGTATVLCGSNFTGVVIEGNTFDGPRTPEQSCNDLGGERPLYRNNTYLNAESREGQGTTRINSGQRLIRPLFENAYVIVDTANVVAQIDTVAYPDGQVVVISGGSTAKPLRFPTGQASYTVAAERLLTGNSLRFQFKKAQGKWQELP